MSACPLCGSTEPRLSRPATNTDPDYWDTHCYHCGNPLPPETEETPTMKGNTMIDDHHHNEGGR